MKQFFLVFFIMLSLTILVAGCSINGKNEGQYHVIIVEGNKNISRDFSKFVNGEFPVTKMEYITSLEVAKEKYPYYEIAKAPAVLVFETSGGVAETLKLKTYDISDAIQFLEGAKETK